ncbi:MAG: HTH domain-containing protein [Bacillus sp. (in: firmicutes)]
MGRFKHNLSIELPSTDNNDYLKEKMLKMMEKFHIEVEQLPKLLGISSEKIKKILEDEPYEWKKGEIELIEYRSLFLTDGFSIMNAKERIKLLIHSFLIEEYQFSYRSLAKYAEVPDEIFHTFYTTDEEIESHYLINICVNLHMLINILKVSGENKC